MKKFFLVSCLGCVGLLILAAVTVTLIGWIGSRRAEFTQAQATYEPLLLSELAESRDASDPQQPAGGTLTAAGRVTLRLAGVDEVKIDACEPGQGPKLDANYDVRSTEFSETMARGDDGGWEYQVTMTATGSTLTRIVQRIFSGERSQLTLCLPPDVPVELVSEMSRGGMTAELGGLWLTGVDVSMEMGGGVVNFGTPLREPMDHLAVRSEMGGGVVAGIGNASPADFYIANRMGGFTADLSGAWKRDALIRVDSTMGGATLILPSSVRVKGAPDLAPDAAGLPENAPVLTFEPGTDFEKVTVQRR